MSAPNLQRRPPLRVVITDRLGRPLAGTGLRRWLTRIAPARARGSLVVALVSDAHMKRLNRLFTGVDRATDVLTFSAEEDGSGVRARGRWPASPSPTAADHLGDIVIAAGVAGRQARAAGHSLRTELRVLALHGLLHLLGYDHRHDRGTMARLECRLRRRGGLREGLIERRIAS